MTHLWKLEKDRVYKIWFFPVIPEYKDFITWEISHRTSTGHARVQRKIKQKKKISFISSNRIVASTLNMSCRWPGGAGDLSSSYQTSAAWGNSRRGKWCLTLPVEGCQLPTAPLLQMNRKSRGCIRGCTLCPILHHGEFRGREGAFVKAQLGTVGLFQIIQITLSEGNWTYAC